MKIAPTCVGKTPAILHRHRARRKHPHMRGKDFFVISRVARFPETPPHAWGRLCVVLSRIKNYGNTPTCVGKTNGFLAPADALQKHPHMRGEDGLQRSTGFAQRETPPHAWGRLNVTRPSAERARNTPTCVGKTIPKLSLCRKVEKHPHMRGEDAVRYKNSGGSARNTPTCVGKTSRARLWRCPQRKHPHMRGEDRLIHIRTG